MTKEAVRSHGPREVSPGPHELGPDCRTSQCRASSGNIELASFEPARPVSPLISSLILSREFPLLLPGGRGRTVRVRKGRLLTTLLLSTLDPLRPPLNRLAVLVEGLRNRTRCSVRGGCRSSHLPRNEDAAEIRADEEGIRQGCPQGSGMAGRGGGGCRDCPRDAGTRPRVLLQHTEVAGFR